MDRVRLAIVGCGNISQLNVPGYLQHPRCDVVALCDTMPERATRRAREWSIAPRIYSDFKQVLDDPAVDAVELLTPTWMHAEQIVAALAAGKHVSAQKPLAISVAEADRIAAAVARASTTFRVTENFLYYPPILKAKELLDSGAIGEPSLVRIHTTRAVQITGQAMELDPDAMVWRRDAGRNPGGPLYDDGVHKYATAVLWIGEIGDISAIVTRGTDFLAETPAAAIWRFKGRDCLGVIDYTAAPEMTIRARYYRADEFFEIHGSRGIIWVTRGTGEMLDMPAVVLIRGAETSTTRCRPTGASASTARRPTSSTACWPAASRPRTSTPRSTFCKCRWRSTRPLASDARCHPTRSSRVGRHHVAGRRAVDRRGGIIEYACLSINESRGTSSRNTTKGETRAHALRGTRID